MTTERDPRTRTVLSWLREDSHENAERVLLRALDEVDATPQRRSWWPARRIASMNSNAKLAPAAGAAERSSRRGDVPILRSLGSLAAAGAAAVVFVVAGAVGLSVYITQQGAASPSPTAVLPTSGPRQSPGTSWPQANSDEMRQAQELADAGDPRYTWQVDPGLVAADAAPWGAEVLERFLREGLGWEEFRHGGGASGDSGGFYTELVFVRCAAGRTNPLYPDDPQARGCAPTIDDFRYETVMLTLEQPVRRGNSGLWVVSEWETLQPWQPFTLYDHLYPDFTRGQVQQVAPPSDAEATAILQQFLEARVAGEGAEQYLHWHEPEAERQLFVGPPYDDVPILYATSEGAAYERYETDRLEGPVWPSGRIDFSVRLFAEDGTEVEQSFAVIRQEDGRIGLAYGFSWDAAGFLETENGLPVPATYSFLGGQVTFEAAPPWNNEPAALYIGNPGHDERFEMITDPRPVATGCEPGPAPADAEALAQSLRSDSDLEATAPVAVRIGGVDALWMDISAAPGASVCARVLGSPLVLTDGTSRSLELGQENRIRLYLLDLPGGSAQVLAIVVAAPEEAFDRVVEAATPIVDSIAFHLP